MVRVFNSLLFKEIIQEIHPRLISFGEMFAYNYFTLVEVTQGDFMIISWGAMTLFLKNKIATMLCAIFFLGEKPQLWIYYSF